jgi:hypothetical protein
MAGHGTIDPIVFPGDAVSSHDHTFFGTMVDENDTGWADLQDKPSTCAGEAADTNKSSYWTPSAYDADGNFIEPLRMTAYYNSDNARGSIVPWGQPAANGDPDFRSITNSTPNCCQVNAQTGTARIDINVVKSCWNGELDSANHRDHHQPRNTPLPGGGLECDEDHPYRIPQVKLEILYPELPHHWSNGSTPDDTTHMHADFLNGHDPTALAILVDACLNVGAKVEGNASGCANGTPLPGMVFEEPPVTTTTVPPTTTTSIPVTTTVPPVTTTTSVPPTQIEELEIRVEELEARVEELEELHDQLRQVWSQ